MAKRDELWNDPPDIPLGPGGINITDGEDSVEYIRRMLDGTPRNFWRHLDEFLAGAVEYLDERRKQVHKAFGESDILHELFGTEDGRKDAAKPFRCELERLTKLLSQARELQRQRNE